MIGPELSPARKAWIGFALWAVFAATGFALTYGFEGKIANYRYGAGMWPRAVFIGIILAGLLQLAASLKSLRARGNSDARGADVDSMDAMAVGGLPVRIVITPVIYVALLPWVGFFAATPLFLAAVMVAMGERRWKRIIPVTAAIFALVVLVFIRLLYVPLPIGAWPGFYDFGNWFVSVVR